MILDMHDYVKFYLAPRKNNLKTKKHIYESRKYAQHRMRVLPAYNT